MKAYRLNNGIIVECRDPEHFNSCTVVHIPKGLNTIVHLEYKIVLFSNGKGGFYGEGFDVKEEIKDWEEE